MLKSRKKRIALAVACAIAIIGTPAFLLLAQPPEGPGGIFGGFGFGFGGPGGPGPGGPGGQERKLVAKFDHDKNGWLDKAERAEARTEAKSSGGFGGPGGRGPGGPGGPGGMRGPGGPGGARPTPKPGEKVAVVDAKKFESESLYDPSVIRTIFLQFDSDDWEAEMADFKPTDVEVPATMIVDGKTYENVGVGFRGASSFFMVGVGSKRSLSISMDLVEPDQRLLGYKSLNLLNSNGDGTLMRSVLYSHVANQFLPTPMVNLVRVVINGEDWGIYQNAQQFDKTFVKDSLKSKGGSRWKVPGSPRGGGGLAFAGDRTEDYRRLYSIKSEDKEAAWQKLILLCKILNETPVELLEQELSGILDIDNVLRFLAVDVALINNDGYWVRASDYNIFLDDKGIFKLVPHDMNESFSGASMGPGGGGMFGGGGRGFGGGRPGEERRGPGGPGQNGPGGPGPNGPGPGGPGPGGPGPGGPGPGGPGGSTAVDLDPLVALDDPSKPLRSKLLKVPSLRTKYLRYVYEVADKGLDWQKLGPVVEGHRERGHDLVEIDSRKLSSNEAYEAGTSSTSSNSGRELSLKQFADQRRKFLMNHPEVLKAVKDR